MMHPDPNLMTSRRGLMLVLSSPSGAGKSTISRRLLAEDEALTMSVSATTRPARPGEIEGRDYYFVGQDRFAKMVAADEMLEHATVFGNSYGTPRQPVEEALAGGFDVLFDVDWQGTQQLRNSRLGDALVSVFILPPSIAELERRLRDRAQDSEEVVRRRMSKARDEISHWAEYDYVLVNADLDLCTKRVRAIIEVERLRRRRQSALVDFVGSLNREFDALQATERES